MKSMRHVVNVMRPTKTKASLGQSQGNPEIVLKNVPCSIENLNGRELELARTSFASANVKVGLYGNPANPIFSTDYCEVVGQKNRKGEARRLNIGSINDRFQNGVELTLICGEEV